MVYKVDLEYVIRFVAEQDDESYECAKLRAERDFSVPGGSVENAAEELRMLAQCIEEKSIIVSDIEVR